ncbi:MAG: hypothetical protein ABWX83_07565 [Luteibacter sp.]
MAIISGVFGIVAFACLIVFLVMRPSDPQTSHLLLRSHDLGIMLQSLCLIPFTLALGAIARRRSAGSSRGMVATGVIFLILVVVLLVLGYVKVVADVLYMIPQGAFGAWLIVVCWQKAIGLPTGLRILGTVAGIGLVLVSIFPIGYALFVDPAILHGPIADNGPTPPGTRRANGIVHIVLAVGTLIGCSMYPLWSVLAGRWLMGRGTDQYH